MKTAPPTGTPSCGSAGDDHGALSLGSAQHCCSDSKRSGSAAPTEPSGYSILYTLKGHTKAVSVVKFSPSGQWIASGSADRSVKMWIAADGHYERTLLGHSQGINDLCWSVDSVYLVTAGDDGTVRIWNATGGAEASAAALDTDGLATVARSLLPLDTCGSATDGMGNFGRAGSCIRILEGHTSHVFCVAMNHQSTIVASGSFDETVRLWNALNGECLRVLPAHSDPVSSVHFSADGSLVCSASYEGLVRVWDARSGLCLRTLVGESENPPVGCARFSPNGKYILVASLDSTVRLWNLLNGSVQRTYQGHINQRYCLFTAIAARERDGDQLVLCGSEDNTIYMWNLQTEELVGKLVAHSDAILGVDYNGKLDLIVSAGVDNDKTIKVWGRSHPKITTANIAPDTKTGILDDAMDTLH